MALFAKALAATGYKGLKMTGNGGKSSVFTSGAGAAGNGPYFSCGCQDATTAPEAKDFAAAYEKMFNTPPSTYSPECFDATNAHDRGAQGGRAEDQRQPDPQGRGRGASTTWTTRASPPRSSSRPTARSPHATVNLYQQKDGKIVMLGKIQDQS